MSDVVERSGIAFGSLYQYFPDKAAIVGTLAERCNAVGRSCVARDLAAVKDDARSAPCPVPHRRQLLRGVPARARDARHLAGDRRPTARCSSSMPRTRPLSSGLLTDAVRRVAPDMPAAALATFSALTMTLIAAAVRHAITLPAKPARRMLDQFKAMLPHDLARLA